MRIEKIRRNASRLSDKHAQQAVRSVSRPTTYRLASAPHSCSTTFVGCVVVYSELRELCVHIFAALYLRPCLRHTKCPTDPSVSIVTS